MKTILALAKVLIVLAMIFLLILSIALVLGYDTYNSVVVVGIMVIILQQAISGMEDD